MLQLLILLHSNQPIDKTKSKFLVIQPRAKTGPGLGRVGRGKYPPLAAAADPIKARTAAMTTPIAESFIVSVVCI